MHSVKKRQACVYVLRGWEIWKSQYNVLLYYGVCICFVEVLQE